MLKRSGHRNRWFFQILLGVALLVLLPGSGLVLAASDLPEGTPSIFQRAGESLRLVLTRDPLQRAELHLTFAERHLVRLERGTTPRAAIVYQSQLTAFSQTLEHVTDGRPEPVWEDNIQGLLARHQARLEAVLRELPEGAKEPTQHAWVQNIASQVDLLLYTADRRLDRVIEDALGGRIEEASRFAEEYEVRMLGTAELQDLLLNARNEAARAAAWASLDRLKAQAQRHRERLIVVYYQLPPEAVGPIERGLNVCAVCGAGGDSN